MRRLPRSVISSQRTLAAAFISYRFRSAAQQLLAIDWVEDGYRLEDLAENAEGASPRAHPRWLSFTCLRPTEKAASLGLR